MTDTFGKIQEFVNYARSLKGYEKGEAQVFCDRLFQAFGYRGYHEAGAKLEYRLKSQGKPTRFPDLVWRPRLLLEMKSRGEKLEEHIQQARDYWADLPKPKPRYVVLCNFDEFWIYDAELQIEEPVNRVKLEELLERYNDLHFLFPGKSGFDSYQTGTRYYENIPTSGAVQFFGRSQELASLHQILQQQDKLIIAAIVGMGGVGKTELAIQHAWQHLQALGDGSGGVCWVDARDGDVGIQLVNFARSLLDLNPPKDWNLKTQLGYCWRNWRSQNWLIVIDDVTDYRKQVKPYLPPKSSQFKVLLTTREELARPVEHLPLEKLQPDAALDLLTSLVGAERIQPELDIAQQICDWLGYLPLGLELVGRYLERDSDLSLKAMLSLLEKKRLRHRSVLEPDATMTARLGVADAFELSWERLDENAQELGCLLSLFALADIPWFLVQLTYSNLLSSENEEVDLDILEELRKDLLRFNLLQRTGELTYRLHQLIREFLREKREQSAQVNDYKQAFVDAMVGIGRLIPNSTVTAKEKPVRNFLPHELIPMITPFMLHMAEVATVLRNFLRDEDLVKPFKCIGCFYEEQGLYDQAEPWFEQCLSVTQARFGSEHLDVATSLSNLGNLYYSQGRYSEAVSLLVQALELRKCLFGNDHLNVVANLNNLATVYHAQGRYSKAEPLCVQALELGKRLVGEEHPYVLDSLGTLALLNYSQGRYSEAEPLYLQTLELKKRLLGEEHPGVAPILTNLGILYEAQGRYSEAESLYMQALELNKRLLGEEHPAVAQSLICLANVYESQKRYSKAEPLYIQVLELRSRLLGEEHPDTATSLNNLAHLYCVQERSDEAESLYKKALELRMRLLGEEHPDVAQSLNNLAGLYMGQKRYNDAQPILVRSLELRKHLLGENHPDVANSLQNLGELYSSQKCYDKAEPLYLKALELNKRLLGEAHPRVAMLIKTLAGLYQFQERHREAEQLWLQAIKLDKRLHGDHHPDVAFSTKILASLYQSQNRYKEAEPLWLQLLELSKRLHGEHHADVATSSNCLASIYNFQGQYSKAEQLSKQALEVSKHLYGENDSCLADCLNNLGACYNSQGQYSKAEPLLVRAVELSKLLHEENHPNLADFLNNLGFCLFSQAKFNKAEAFYLESLELRTRLLGEEHLAVAESLWNLAALYCSQEHYSKAQPCLRQALKIYQQKLGNNHPETIDCQRELLVLRQTIQSQAENLYKYKPKNKKRSSNKKDKGFGK